MRRMLYTTQRPQVAAVRTHLVTDGDGARVAAVVVRHERALLRVARQASLCDDDAHDAYQRALEIFVRRVATVDPATEVAWLKVVIRHEAMAIRRARSESVAGEALDLDAIVPGQERSVEEQIASGERVRRSAEALRALKPDEAQALMMKAHGLSYDEISARNGWSYTKVNRAITEGRRRFLRAYAGIEAGEECERFAPIVQALSSGEASASEILQIRPHLRHCTACRAQVRDLHLSRLRRVSLFWAALFHRTQASDLATGVHAATAGGGGRLSTVATILGMCLSGATVGTVCAVSGVLPDSHPPRVVREARHPPREPARHTERPPRDPTATAAVVRQTEAPPVRHPDPAPARSPDPAPRTAHKPERRSKPHATPTPAPAEQEFSFENRGAPAATAATAQASTPEAAPAPAAPDPAPPAPAQAPDSAQAEFTP
jgi:RNA polymerase sigma factor (sigma-70 family)